MTSKVHSGRWPLPLLAIAQVLVLMTAALRALAEPGGSVGNVTGTLSSGQTAGTASSSFIVVAKSAAAPSAEPTLSVSQTGWAVLTLLKVKPEDAPQKVNLYLSSFSDQSGSPVTVSLAKNEQERGKPVLEGLDFNAPLRLSLSVSGLAPNGRCFGTLIVESVDKDDKEKRELFETIKLTLSRPGPATLVVAPTTVALSVTQPAHFLGIDYLLDRVLPSLTSPEPTVTTTLRDKNGQMGLDHVCASVEQITKAPGGQFDLKTNVDFEWNGSPATDFTDRCDDPTNARTIPPNGQAVVRMRLKELRTGEYNVTLRFRAVNSQADDGQKLVLTLQVSDSPARAVIALAIAMALSYAGTKLISMRKQRLTLLGRIAELRPAWLRTEPPVLPVVWARAVVRLTFPS